MDNKDLIEKFEDLQSKECDTLLEKAGKLVGDFAEVMEARNQQCFIEGYKAAQNQWQPMETAPKDRQILLCISYLYPQDKRWTHNIDVYWWDDKEGGFRNESECLRCVENKEDFKYQWQPLPQPPVMEY